MVSVDDLKWYPGLRRSRLVFIEHETLPDADFDFRDYTGFMSDDSCWWVDVDLRTGIAYGYVGDPDTPWITDDDLPEEP